MGPEGQRADGRGTKLVNAPSFRLHNTHAKVPDFRLWLSNNLESRMRRPTASPKPAPTGVSGTAKTGPRFDRAIVPALVLACLTATGAFWWMCDRSEAIAFLPARAGAEWVVLPSQAKAAIRDALPATVAFRYSFNLTAQPANASLAVCAFKRATVTINGRRVSSPPSTRRNWKLPSSAEVADLLQPGKNVITAWVTNAVGPPALWLLLESAGLSLGTSEHWQVSLNETEWQSARRARQPLEFQPDSALYRGTRMMDLLKRVWPVEAAFCAAALALVWGLNRWLRRKRLQARSLPATTSTKLIYGLFAIVLIARGALFINNLPQLPRSVGFDALGHEEYIQFIQQKHALPLANDGWEMFHPPLYYLASALVLDACGRSAGDADATFYLRAVNARRNLDIVLAAQAASSPPPAATTNR